MHTVTRPSGGIVFVALESKFCRMKLMEIMSREKWARKVDRTVLALGACPPDHRLLRTSNCNHHRRPQSTSHEPGTIPRDSDYFDFSIDYAIVVRRGNLTHDSWQRTSSCTRQSHFVQVTFLHFTHASSPSLSSITTFFLAS